MFEKTFERGATEELAAIHPPPDPAEAAEPGAAAGCAGAVMAEQQATLAVRVRIEHSRTQRDGWGYSTTVEVTSGDLDDLTDLIPDLLTDARLMANQERDIRNRLDAAGRDAIAED